MSIWFGWSTLRLTHRATGIVAEVRWRPLRRGDEAPPLLGAVLYPVPVIQHVAPGSSWSRHASEHACRSGGLALPPSPVRTTNHSAGKRIPEEQPSPTVTADVQPSASQR